MKTLIHLLVIALVSVSQTLMAQSKTNVETFNKVVISPHIETIFVQGSEESVTILDNKVSDDKVNIKSKNGTLHVYLEDAKLTTKQKKVKENGKKMKVPVYQGTILKVKVIYKYIDNLSLRGEETTVCESPLNGSYFHLKIYGESQVTINEINIVDFDVDVYGESELTINKGVTNTQQVTAYGEGKITMTEVVNTTSKLKAYGEAEFRVNVSENIKFTAYGEAELYYKGKAEVNQGLSFGDSQIRRID